MELLVERVRSFGAATSLSPAPRGLVVMWRSAGRWSTRSRPKAEVGNRAGLLNPKFSSWVTNQGDHRSGFEEGGDGVLFDYRIEMTGYLKHHTRSASEPGQVDKPIGLLLFALSHGDGLSSEFRATRQNFSPAIRELDASMQAGRRKHDGNRVLEWRLTNMEGKADRWGNLYPTRQRADQQIDAAIALMMASERGRG
jgi:hypothetical protein